MRRLILVAIVVLLACPVTQISLVAKGKVAKALSNAWNQRRKEEDKSLKTAQDVLAGNLGEVAKDQKQSAYDLIYDIYMKKRQWDKALEALDAQLKAFPDNTEVGRKVIFRKNDAFRRKGKDYDQAVSQLHDFIQHNQKEPELCAEVLLRSYDFLKSMKKYDEAYQDAQKALKLAKGNLRLQIDSLWKMQDVAGHMKDEAKKAEAILESLQPQYRDYMRDNDVEYRISIYADCLARLKRFGDVRTFLVKEIERSNNAERRQDWALKVANSFYDEKKYPEALDAYERVISDHPTVTRYWKYAQDRRIDILGRLEKYPQALQEMKIVFADCRNDGEVRWACERVASMFRNIDKNSDRCDLFIAYQILGPAGPDGKTGTGDDLKNPLDKVSFPNYPNRRKALDKVIAESGDSCDDATYRGMAYLYTGRPKQALPEFIDALQRYTDGQYHEPVVSVLLRGMRGVSNDSHGVSAATDYILYGPAGPDGKKGTDDDVKNPFASIKRPSHSYTKAQKDELQLVWNELASFAENPREDRNRRKLSVNGLRRIYETEALDPQPLHDRTLTLLKRNVDRYSAGSALALGMATSRQYGITLAPCQQFRKFVEESAPSIDDRTQKSFWSNFDKSIKYIKKYSTLPKLRLPKKYSTSDQDSKKSKKKKKRKK